MRYQSIILLAVSLTWIAPIHAHHNGAAHYDLTKISQVEGVVTKFKFINPHARFYFDVTNESGETEKWMAEGDGASVLGRRGWTGDELKPGDRVKVTGNPSRNGSPKIEWQSIIRPDGSEILGGNGVVIEQQRTLKDLEARRAARRSAATNNQ